MKVEASERWNDSGVDVEVGSRIQIRARGAWIDGGIPTGPEGFEKPWLSPWRWTRRCRPASWFELVAVVGKFDGPYHRIGRENGFVATRSGRVYLFANDAWPMYWNNKGSIEAEVSKVD